MQKFIAHDVYGTNEYGAAVTEVTPIGEPKAVYLASDVDAKFKEYDDDNLALSQAVKTLGARIAKLEEVAGAALGVLNSDIRISPRSMLHDDLKSLMER